MSHHGHLKTGAYLSHYRIIDHLGTGGMGEVFVAEDIRLERRVALKVLPSEVANDRDRLERFEREAKVLAAIDHPNIVTVFSVEAAPPRGEESSGEETLHFLTMQLVEGRPLTELISDEGMPADRILDIASQLTAAMAAAHGKGIIHRDLKPANVMVGDDGRVRVLDFGLAKLRGPAEVPDASQLPTAVLTQDGVVLGTMPYMSPEQVRGRAADARSDLFAFGIMLYEMSTGVRPFTGETTPELMLSIATGTPRPADELQPGFPHRLARLIDRCLEKEPESRCQSAQELATELEQIRLEPGGDTPVVAEPVSTASGAGAGWKRWWWVAALLLVAAVAVVGWRLTRNVPVVAESPSSIADAEPPAESEPGLMRDRVLVVPFENRTGNPTLDSVSLMAADWITEGLAATGMAQVVSSVTVLSSLRNVGEGLEQRAGLRQLADDTGAGTVVSGAYYRQGEDLLFSAETNDLVRGELVGAIEPVATTASDPLGAIEEVRQQVMVMVAAHLNTRLSPSLRPLQLPSFEAYRRYTQGLEQFIRMDFQGAIERFEETVALDPEWAQPLLAAAMAYINLNEFDKAEALANRAEPHRESLSVHDRHFLDRILATCHGNALQALSFSRQMAEVAPGGPSAFDAAAMAVRLNFVQEAVNRLEALDPEKGFTRGFVPYWYYLTNAYHVLGEHKEELASALRSRELYAEQLDPRWFEIRSLIGLGRHEEIAPLLDEAESLRGDWVTPGDIMLDAASELGAHGFPDAELQTAKRALQWFRDRPAGDLENPRSRASLGRALFETGEHEEAGRVLAALRDQYPNNLEYRGYLGLLAAARGDREEVEETLAWFEQVDRPYLFGENIYWRSAIHARMGNLEEAVRLYREALAAGLPFGWPRPHPHADSALRPLRNYPAFEKVIAPRE